MNAPISYSDMRLEEQNFLLPVYDRAYHQVIASDVVMIEGDGNYTLFYFSSGKKLMVSKTLKQYETLLDSHSFVRVHKSYLINLNYLQGYDERHEEVIILRNGLKAEVSRRRRKDFQLRAEPFLLRMAS